MPSRWFTGKPHSKDPARQTKFPPETEFGTRSPTGTTERFRVLADRSSGSETVCIRISGPAPLPVSETGESADRDSKPSASGAACRISCVSDRETERKLRVQRGSRLAPVRQRERAYPISPIRQPGTGWNRLSRFPKTESACRTASENQRKRNESPMADKKDAGSPASRIFFIRPSAERIPATAAILTGRQPS